MEWLKDKKNLPIVVAIAVFVILGFGGLIAYELGAFQPSQTITTAPLSTMPVGTMPPGINNPPGTIPGMPPGRMGSPGRQAYIPGASTPGMAMSVPAATVAVKPVSTNPAVGPDPFYIPGGQKKIAALTGASGMKLPVRDLIAPLNLFQIHPPTPPSPPVIVGANGNANQDPAANYRLEGIVTGSDGINAILEVGGQSQTVKPGDSLPDGSSVQNIQTTSITLKTAGGTVFNLPLSAGNPDQGTNNPYGQQPYQGAGMNSPYGQPQFNPGFGGRPQYNGQPSFNGQPPFDPQGK